MSAVPVRGASVRPRIALVATTVKIPLHRACLTVERDHTAVLVRDPGRTDANHHLGDPILIEVGNRRTRIDSAWPGLAGATRPDSGHGQTFPLQCAIGFIGAELAILVSENDFIDTIGINVGNHRRRGTIPAIEQKDPVLTVKRIALSTLRCSALGWRGGNGNGSENNRDECCEEAMLHI